MKSEKHNEIKFIENFLNDKSLFFSEIDDSGYFNKNIFHKYTHSIVSLNSEKLSTQERFHVSRLVWEINFKILGYLGSNSDPEDFFNFENLEEDDPRQIYNILYYTANWFSYEKEMNLSSISIGGWK